MMLARLGSGRWTHAVHYRPDLTPRWRSVCGRARSDTVTPRGHAHAFGRTEQPGCPWCRDELLNAAAFLGGAEPPRLGKTTAQMEAADRRLRRHP